MENSAPPVPESEDYQSTNYNIKTSVPDYSLEDYQSRNYDPQYTAEISNRMQVPDKIGMDEEGVRYTDVMQDNLMTRNGMIVPERIVMAGEEKHIGLRKNLPLLDFGMAPPENYNQLNLLTPPRILSMGEVTFPSVESREQERAATPTPSLHSNLSGTNNGTPHHLLAQPEALATRIGAGDAALSDQYEVELEPPAAALGESLIHADEDEMVVLRRQVAKLSRRLMRVEQENMTRSQRELILYPIVVSYILFQVAAWFLRSNK